jgi:hypothetical protein
MEVIWKFMGNIKGRAIRQAGGRNADYGGVPSTFEG